MKSRFWLALLTFTSAMLLCGPAAQAEITWGFEYINPGSDIGFFDPVQGAERRQALEDAASQWGKQFTNTGYITLEVLSEEDNNTNTLASAGSYIVDSGVGGFGDMGVIRQKLLTGNDLNGSSVDGIVSVNWANNWGLSAQANNVAPGTYDFYSTMYHEFTHALGFNSFIMESGTDIFGTTPGDVGSWSAFDQFITDQYGNPVIDGTDFSLNDYLWNAEKTGGASPDGGLYFNGAHAVAANGGLLVGLFTPSEWSDGSSVSHLDDDNPDYLGSLMLAATGDGPSTRAFTAVERGMMKDLGYCFTPLPPTIILFGPALFSLGFFRARRRMAWNR